MCALHYTTIQRILHPESNSTCRRQRALRVLLLHTEGKETFIPDIPVFPDIPVIPDTPGTFRTFQSFMTFQPFQAILQILQCSSISRESTPFQHSPIRMHILHILQFDWFPQKKNSTEYQLGNYKHYILQRKGDVVISVKRASVKMSR